MICPKHQQDDRPPPAVRRLYRELRIQKLLAIWGRIIATEILKRLDG